MPRPKGSPYTEDVTIASCSTLIPAVVRPKMEVYCPFSSIFHSHLVHPWQHIVQAFQSDPNLLPWCGARARVPPRGGGVTLYTPRGPGRRPRWTGGPVQPSWLLGACPRMRSAVGKRHVRSRPGSADTDGGLGLALFVGGVSPCLNITQLTGVWVVGLSTAREPGRPVALRVQEVTRLHALQLIIGGLDKIDLDDWKSNTRLKHCGADSNVVRWFWQAVETFDEERRARLLQFVTGSTRVPLQGFKALQGDCSGGRAGGGRGCLLASGLSLGSRPLLPPLPPPGLETPVSSRSLCQPHASSIPPARAVSARGPTAADAGRPAWCPRGAGPGMIPPERPGEPG